MHQTRSHPTIRFPAAIRFTARALRPHEEQPSAYVELALSSASVADTFGMILASRSEGRGTHEERPARRAVGEQCWGTT